MADYAIIVTVGIVVILILLTEIVAAVLPIVVIITLVPPEQREGLAKVVAACDSSRKLRLWPALRLAVRASRRGARSS